VIFEVDACFEVLKLLWIDPIDQQINNQKINNRMKDSQCLLGRSAQQPCVHLWSEPETKINQKIVKLKFQKPNKQVNNHEAMNIYASEPEPQHV
jgi:hypothetical protein